MDSTHKRLMSLQNSLSVLYFSFSVVTQTGLSNVQTPVFPSYLRRYANGRLRNSPIWGHRIIRPKTYAKELVAKGAEAFDIALF
jgi:hypothetical protein